MTTRHAFTASLGAVLALGPLAARAQQGSYKIGVTYPLTGPLAINTPVQFAGAELATADINARGGVSGRQIQLVVEDTQGTPQGGVAAMRKLVQVDGVQAILTIFTNVVNAQMPLSDQLRVPTLSTIETPGLVGKSQFSFAHSQTMETEGPLLRQYWKQSGYKRIYALYGNNGFGQLIAPIVKGLVVAAPAEYAEAFLDFGSTDYRGVVTRVREFNPDGIFISAQGSTAEIAAIKQIRELGLTMPIFNGSNPYYDRDWRIACGPYSEKMFFVGLNVDPVAGKDFIRKFKAKENSPPSYQPGLVYDIIQIYAYAIGKVGYSGEAIRNAVASLNGEISSVVGGKIRMGADHYTIPTGIALWQVQRGNQTRILPK
jgi:branched-chain amino acid transport system substrate-binding protein